MCACVIAAYTLLAGLYGTCWSRDVGFVTWHDIMSNVACVCVCPVTDWLTVIICVARSTATLHWWSACSVIQTANRIISKWPLGGEPTHAVMGAMITVRVHVSITQFCVVVHQLPMITEGIGCCQQLDHTRQTVVALQNSICSLHMVRRSYCNRSCLCAFVYVCVGGLFICLSVGLLPR